MNDEEVLDVVRGAIIWAKADLVTLAPGQVNPPSVLGEPPIYLDSLEFIAMVTHLEDVFGLIADDEHFSPRSMRTVSDVVEGVKVWIAEVATRSDVRTRRRRTGDRLGNPFDRRPVRWLGSPECSGTVGELHRPGDATRYLGRGRRRLRRLHHRRAGAAGRGVRHPAGGAGDASDRALRHRGRVGGALRRRTGRPTGRRDASPVRTGSHAGRDPAEVTCPRSRSRGGSLLHSGTDGRPKGVVRTKASLALEDVTVGGHLGMAPGARSSAPYRCPRVRVHRRTLRPAVVRRHLDPRATRLAASLAKWLATHQPEIVVAVPAQYAAWSTLRHAYAGPLPRLWLCGGAPLPTAVRAKFEAAWGGVIAEQYGMTECGAVSVDLDGAGTLGRPYPGVTVSIDRSASQRRWARSLSRPRTARGATSATRRVGTEPVPPRRLADRRHRLARCPWAAAPGRPSSPPAQRAREEGRPG